jgi:hypothetical protein
VVDSFTTDLHDNLTYFKVPQTGIDFIRSKLAFKIFDEYANILKGMYSTRFNELPKIKVTMTRWTPPLAGPHPPSSPLSKSDSQIRSVAKRLSSIN